MSSSQLTATNQWALILGSFLIAYAPMLFLFIFIVYPKPQLMIIVTSYAFAYLLSATFSSVLYTILNAIFQFNHNSNSSSNVIHSDDNRNDVFSSDGVLAAIIPSIFFQFVFRCLFTSLYHKVERVIQLSLQRQEAQEDNAANTTTNSNSNNGTVDTVAGTVTTNDATPPNHSSSNSSSPTAMDIAKFKLALNDTSAAIAAAIGFGGMHAITLYGTLLSSEAVNNTTGILYQDSCPAVPSLVVSAVTTNLFTILQIFWMLFTFFGMRRRLLFHRGQCADYEEPGVTPEVMNEEEDDDDDRRRHRRTRSNSKSGRWLGNSRTGGNYALLFVLLTHSAAALVTLFNRQTNGCYIVLPSLFGIVLFTAYLFYMGCGRIYMPPKSTTTTTGSTTITTTATTTVPPASSSSSVATTRVEGYQSHVE
jgi:Aph-1 protein